MEIHVNVFLEPKKIMFSGKTNPVCPLLYYKVMFFATLMPERELKTGITLGVILKLGLSVFFLQIGGQVFSKLCNLSEYAVLIGRK